MQQHSGQHILSQSFYELLHGETLSFHLGEQSSTVEIGLEKIKEEEVERVEKRANEIIFQDREIKNYFVHQERIEEIPLRKPPKKEGLIRVVEVSDFDYSACGGTHCRRSGEIGMIKITKWERIRNNLRFEFLCGERALRDYALKSQILRQLSTQLTVHEKELSSSIEKLFQDLKSLKKKTKKLQERMAFYEAQEVIKNSKGKVIKEILKEKTPEEARLLALNITRQGDFVVLYGLEAGTRGHLVLACSENLNLDLRELVPVISSFVRGKGGGSSSLVEITTEEKANLELALDKAYEYIERRI
jgi:alanyl-tRNA synthetase